MVCECPVEPVRADRQRVQNKVIKGRGVTQWDIIAMSLPAIISIMLASIG